MYLHTYPLFFYFQAVNQRKPLPSADSQQQGIQNELYNLNKKLVKPNDANFRPSSQIINFEQDEEFICEVVKENSVEQINLSTDTIIQNQNLLLENQLRIIEQLATQETMLQLICQHLSKAKITPSISQASDVVTTSNGTTPADPLPIESLEKLEVFERDLNNDEYMNEMVS